jgi:hypothetical protein
VTTDVRIPVSLRRATDEDEGRRCFHISEPECIGAATWFIASDGYCSSHIEEELITTLKVSKIAGVLRAMGEEYAHA